MKRYLLIAFSLMSASTAAFAIVQSYYDETRCRSIYSQNYVYWYGRATATGFADEVIIFKNMFGDEVSRQTVGWWIGRTNDPRVFEVVGHSNGQFSIRFNVPFFQQPLVNGSFEIQRAGNLIDRDPILAGFP